MNRRITLIVLPAFILLSIGIGWTIPNVITLRAQVAELQARPQGHSQIEVIDIDLDGGWGSKHIRRLELAPQEKALLVVHADYEGILKLQVTAKAKVEILGSLSRANLEPRGLSTTTTDERDYTAQWEAQVFRANLRGAVDSQHTWLVKISNPDEEEKTFRVVAEASH